MVGDEKPTIPHLTDLSRQTDWARALPMHSSERCGTHVLPAHWPHTPCSLIPRALDRRRRSITSSTCIAPLLVAAPSSRLRCATTLLVTTPSSHLPAPPPAHRHSIPAFAPHHPLLVTHIPSSHTHPTDKEQKI
jgi:hypothetical protein